MEQVGDADDLVGVLKAGDSALADPSVTAEFERFGDDVVTCRQRVIVGIDAMGDFDRRIIATVTARSEGRALVLVEAADGGAGWRPTVVK